MNLSTFKERLFSTIERIGFDIKELRDWRKSLIDNDAPQSDGVWSSQRVSDLLSDKVDKINGMGLSETNFSQAEKSKLSTLESSKYKGQFPSKISLDLSFPEGSDSTWHENKAGFYADVDHGVGEPVTRYAWDSNDFVWVRQLGESALLTGAQIKTMYEGQPDTNAFTDAEKTKLNDFTQLTGAEIKTLYEGQPDTNAFTDAEKTKLGDSVEEYRLNGEVIPIVDKLIDIVVEPTEWTELRGDQKGVGLDGFTDKQKNILSKIQYVKSEVPNGWSGIAYGNGIYVACAWSDNSNITVQDVAISTDAINWTYVTSLNTDDYSNWYCYFANGRFFISGGDNVMTSTNGIDWDVVIVSNVETNDTFSRVCYGNGEFLVACKMRVNNADVTYFLKSIDGIVWTRSSVDLENVSVETIEYFKGMFYAGGSNGLIVSSDGIEWNEVVTPITEKFYYIASSDDTIAVMYNDGVIISTDGITWTVAVMPEDGVYLTSIAYGNGVFLATNYYEPTAYVYSTDGVEWKYGDLFDEGAEIEIYNVCFGDNKFVAVSSYPYNNISHGQFFIIAFNSEKQFENIVDEYRQNDMILPIKDKVLNIENPKWLNIKGNQKDVNLIGFADGLGNRPVISQSINLGFTINDIVYGNGIYVGIVNVGFGATNVDDVAYSMDGVNWTMTRSQSSDPNSNREILFLNDTFFIINKNETLSSVDGINWNIVNTPPTFRMTLLSYGNGIYLAFGHSHDDSGNFKYITSTDGINWDDDQLYTQRSGLYDIVFFNGTFYSCNDDITQSSTDGITWTTIDGIYGHSFAVSNDTLVITSEIFIFSTKNGTDWTTVTTPTFSNPINITYGNGIFTAVCSRAPYIFIYSTDGINWHYGHEINEDVDSYDYINSVCYGDDKFIIATDYDEIILLDVAQESRFENTVNEYYLNGQLVEPINKKLMLEVQPIDISNKVDKVEGMGLSETNFTQEEKNKLATLNVYTPLTGAEIKTLYEGQSDTNAFTDAEKSKLNDFVQLTGAEIKTLYEGQSDTNAFTDAEKTKLSGLNTAGSEIQQMRTGQAYTLTNTDVGTVITINNVAAEITVNTNSITKIGDIIEIEYMGDGTFEWKAGTATLLFNGNDSAFADGKYSRMACQKMSETEYRIFGQLQRA